MLCTRQILVSRVAPSVSAVLIGLALATLAGCGQQGPLYLPTDPAAANRATLPQTLRPGSATQRQGASPALPSSPAPLQPSDDAKVNPKSSSNFSTP